MITQYHRPKSLEEALKLLAEPNTCPLGGGTVLTQNSDESFAVVDLQALGLDKIRKSGNNLEIGATVTLSQLMASSHIPAALAKSIRHEVSLNLRNACTVAGTLVACDGRSPFTTAMLALDAKLTLLPGEEKVSLGDWLPTRKVMLQGKLIIKVEIPLNIRLAFETVARTPADRPIVCTVLTQWPSGRTRLALGGFGPAPLLALDGNGTGGVEAAARNVCANASDEWASADYRMDIAAVLAKRCLEN